MNQWDRVTRLFGDDVLALLASRTAAIVGLGSGGSFVAVSLAMSGVGRFVLIDDDVLERANIVRHAADLREVGRPKAEAVADLIQQRHPAAQVEVVTGRIEDHLEVLRGADVVVVGVDQEPPKYAINEACLQYGLTAVYAGVYERGEGGDVCIIDPRNGPCYACWAEHLREGLDDRGPEKPLDYGMIGPDGTLAAEPGLWLHVVRIAAIQADMALNHLLHGTPAYRTWPGNTIIQANVALEIFEGRMALPHTAEWVTVPANPQCLVCASQRQSQARQESSLSLEDLLRLGQAASATDDRVSNDEG